MTNYSKQETESTQNIEKKKQTQLMLSRERSQSKFSRRAADHFFQAEAPNLPTRTTEK